MRIGIDLDNTIVCYDHIFYKEAAKYGLIPEFLSPQKNLIRQYVKENSGEEKWIFLQSIVYGQRADDARPYPGAVEFISQTVKNFDIHIISHKTNSTIHNTTLDMVKSAKLWLDRHQITNILPMQAIHFENTRRNKVLKIKKVKCDVFIDDLLDIFLHHNFPDKTQKILFDPSKFYRSNSNINTVSSWAQINNLIQNID